MVDARIREYGFVYGIRSLDLIKIGVANDIDKRMNKMRLHNPHGIELVFYMRHLRLKDVSMKFWRIRRSVENGSKSP